MYDRQDAIQAGTAQNFNPYAGHNIVAGKLNDAPAQPRMQSSLQDIQMLAENAAKLRSRLYEMKDRAFGSEPEAKGAGVHPRPVPNGAADAIMLATGDVASILSDCHDLITRLERLV